MSFSLLVTRIGDENCIGLSDECKARIRAGFANPKAWPMLRICRDGWRRRTTRSAGGRRPLDEVMDQEVCTILSKTKTTTKQKTGGCGDAGEETLRCGAVRCGYGARDRRGAGANARTGFRKQDSHAGQRLRAWI